MGFLDWLFGKDDEEEDEEPEILVLGAKLRCPYGDRDSFLYVDTDDIDLNNLPEACVSDNEALFNILSFGPCYLGTDCEYLMKIEQEWENPKPQTKEVNGKEAITTDSILMCNASGMMIEVISSGQDGIFAEQILLMREMDELYPGLRELLEDPYGSLYLKEGMYEKAIQFLADRMNKNGGNIFIFGLDTAHNLEDRYIMGTLDRLLHTCSTKEPGQFLNQFETYIYNTGVNNLADPHYLNADLIEVLKSGCGKYAKEVAAGGFARWNEGHKMFLDFAAETVNTWMYVSVAYASMKGSSRKPVKDASKNVKSKGTENTTRVGRWMSRDEYNKMTKTGKVQMSGEHKIHVANPANIKAFEKQAPPNSIYVEFDVPNYTVFQGGREDWGIVAGPGSLNDRLNQRKGLPPIKEMPNATNIKIIKE